MIDYLCLYKYFYIKHKELVFINDKSLSYLAETLIFILFVHVFYVADVWEHLFLYESLYE